MNGFLYVLFTKSVRKTVFTTVSCHHSAKDKDGRACTSVAALAGGVSLNGPPGPATHWCHNEVPRGRRDTFTSEIITPVPITQSM